MHSLCRSGRGDLVIHSSIKYVLGAHSLLRMYIKRSCNIVTSFKEFMCFDVLYILSMGHVNCKVLQSLNSILLNLSFISLTYSTPLILRLWDLAWLVNQARELIITLTFLRKKYAVLCPPSPGVRGSLWPSLQSGGAYHPASSGQERIKWVCVLGSGFIEALHAFMEATHTDEAYTCSYQLSGAKGGHSTLEGQEDA